MESTETRCQTSDESPIDLRAYLDVFLKRKWTILLVFVASVTGVTTYSLRQTKIYSATASLVIESMTPKVLGEDVREAVDLGTSSYWFSKEFYETQYKIIRSRQIAERVCDSLGLNRDASFLGIEALPTERQQEYIEKADAPSILLGRLFVEPVKDSRIVNLRVEDPNPERAAALANAFANAYMQTNLERRVEGSKDASEWLQDQMADLKTKLSASELALFNFKKDNDLVYTTFENRQTITSQKLLAINDTLTKVRTRKAELDARVKSIRAAKETGELERLMELSVVASSAFINQLKLAHAQIANEVSDLEERYGPDHPKLKAARERLGKAKRTLVTEIDAILGANLADYHELQATERNLQAMLEEEKRQAFEINKKEIDYKRLAREEENNQRLFELVAKRTKELDLSSMLKANNVRVLDPAKIPLSPVKPKLRTNLMLAMVLGLLAGFGIAMLLELMDRSVKSHQDLEAMGVHFLGLIPSIKGNGPGQLGQRDLFVHDQPKSSVAECCRTVRTNLLFMSPDNPAKRLVVTSASPQEGKTTTLISLGLTLAQGGARVLLVDSDMRRPRLHRSFGLANDVGLSSLIVGESSVEEAVRKTMVPGVFVLTSGPIPPNPAELLHTARFQELARKLGERFDRVLFDSPPVGAVTDPLVLANQLDGTVIVAKMLRSNKDLVQRAVKSLAGANANILGAILNDVDIEKRQYGYYSGYYSYGKYYDQGKEAA